MVMNSMVLFVLHFRKDKVVTIENRPKVASDERKKVCLLRAAWGAGFRRRANCLCSDCEGGGLTLCMCYNPTLKNWDSFIKSIILHVNIKITGKRCFQKTLRTIAFKGRKVSLNTTLFVQNPVHKPLSSHR